MKKLVMFLCAMVALTTERISHRNLATTLAASQMVFFTPEARQVMQTYGEYRPPESFLDQLIQPNLSEFLEDENLNYNPDEAARLYRQRWRKITRHGVALSASFVDFIRTRNTQNLGLAIQRFIQSIGGLFVKVAQGVALRRDLIPMSEIRDPLRATFEKNKPSFSDDELREKIDAFMDPTDVWEICTEDDPKYFERPGSIAQTNLVKVNGQYAVLKTLHRTVKIKYMIDYYILKKIFRKLIQSFDWISSKFPELVQSMAMLKLIAKMVDFTYEDVLHEFDFVQEAENMVVGKSLFEDSDLAVYVPDVLRASHDMLLQEFIDQPSLQDVLAAWRGPFIHEMKVMIVEQVVKAMGFMVFKGVFHGDLHPGNILVSPEGGITIIDWGSISRIPENDLAAFGSILNLVLSSTMLSRQPSTLINSNTLYQGTMELKSKGVRPSITLHTISNLAVQNFALALNVIGKKMHDLGWKITLKGTNQKDFFFNGLFALTFPPDLQYVQEGETLADVQANPEKGFLSSINALLAIVDDMQIPNYFLSFQKNINLLVGTILAHNLQDSIKPSHLWYEFYRHADFQAATSALLTDIGIPENLDKVVEKCFGRIAEEISPPSASEDSVNIAGILRKMVMNGIQSYVRGRVKNVDMYAELEILDEGTPKPKSLPTEILRAMDRIDFLTPNTDS